MEPISPTVTVEQWVSDPASALSDTAANIAGIMHAHPILGWIGIAYLAALVAAKKIELPAPYGTILHAVANLAWMFTATKVQKQSDVQAITHSESLGVLTGIMRELGNNATVEDLVARVSVSLHEPYRSEILKMLADPGQVIVAVTGSEPAAPVVPAIPTPSAPSFPPAKS